MNKQEVREYLRTSDELKKAVAADPTLKRAVQIARAALKERPYICKILGVWPNQTFIWSDFILRVNENGRIVRKVNDDVWGALDGTAVCDLINSSDQIMRYVEEPKEDDNPPLSIKELKDMYNADDTVVYIQYGVSSFPAILDFYDDKLVAVWNACDGEDGKLWEDSYGIKWVAYKRRPKDEEAET